MAGSKVEGIVPGSQRLTFYRTLGGYQRTAPLAQVPASDEAQVHPLGGSYKAGARAVSHNNYPFMFITDYPRLERVTPDAGPGRRHFTAIRGSVRFVLLLHRR